MQVYSPQSTVPKPLTSYLLRPTSYVLLFFFFLFSNSSFSQKPSWFDFDKRKVSYPDAEYFTGFGMARLTKGESLEDNLKAAESYAQQELIESIQVTVQSIAVHELSEQNQEIRESYKQAVSSFSKVSLPGIEDETWYDKKKKTAYAFAWINKQELAGYYQDQLNMNATKLDAKLQKAKQLFASNQKQKALEAYQACFPILRQMEEALAMLITIGLDPGGKLPGVYENDITASISNITQNTNLTLDEMCQLLAGSLKTQLGANEHTIRLVPFTYQDTRMASELSARFVTLFGSKLASESMKVSTMGIAGKQHPLMLTGTYWEDGDYLKFIASVKELSTGTTLASAENRIPKSRLTEAGVLWKPENFEEAMVRMKIFSEGEIIGGGLLLDIWTDQGSDNLLYQEGETMKLYVKVNHECYLRFIYYFADGINTLLLPGDYYIDSDMVNKVVEIPTSFDCAPPFGVEALQVIAQTDKLPPLFTEEKDGYFFIKDEASEILKKVRGFKRYNDQQLFAEKRLVITTIP